MSIGNILGGLGRGITAGVHELRQQDQANFLKEQQQWLKEDRARQQAEIEREQAYQTDLRGIVPVGQKYIKDAQEGQLDETGMGPGRPMGIEREQTEEDWLRAIADTAARHGKVDTALAMADRKRSNRLTDVQIETAENTLTQQEAQQHVRDALVRFQNNDLGGALRVLHKQYMRIPDGQDIVIDEKAGTWGIAGQDGKWVHPPQPISKESIGALLERANQLVNTDQWAAIQQVEQGNRRLNQADDHFTRNLGFQREQLGETSRHNRAVEGITSARNGILSRSQQTPYEQMAAKVDAYAKALIKSGQVKDPATAELKAWQAVLKPQSETKVSGDGTIIQHNGKFYQQDMDGQYTEIQLGGPGSRIMGMLEDPEQLAALAAALK